MGLPKKPRRRYSFKHAKAAEAGLEVVPPPAHLAYKVIGFPNLGMRLDLGRVYTLAELELRCIHSPARRRALHLKLADPKTFKPALHSKLALKLANFDLGPRRGRCPKLPGTQSPQACSTLVPVPSDRCEDKFCQGLDLPPFMEALFRNNSVGFPTSELKRRRKVLGEQGTACSTKWKAGSLHESAVVGSCSTFTERGCEGSAGCVHRGAIVRLHSLRVAPEMNGRTGLCLYTAESDRWVVHIDGEPPGSFYNIRQKNLQVVPSERESNTEAAPATAQAVLGASEMHGLVEIKCREKGQGFFIDPDGPKRRLLLKWHSDREILAKEITQELQCSLHWKYLKLSP